MEMRLDSFPPTVVIHDLIEIINNINERLELIMKLNCAITLRI